MKAQFVITEIEWLFKQHDEENEINEIMIKNKWTFDDTYVNTQAIKDIELAFPLTLKQEVWVDGFENVFKIKNICFLVDENKTKYFLEIDQ